MCGRCTLCAVGVLCVWWCTRCVVVYSDCGGVLGVGWCTRCGVVYSVCGGVLCVVAILCDRCTL